MNLLLLIEEPPTQFDGSLIHVLILLINTNSDHNESKNHNADDNKNKNKNTKDNKNKHMIIILMGIMILISSK